jgi:lipoprotein-anchoring transpeptidase ErfK/SrfK
MKGMKTWMLSKLAMVLVAALVLALRAMTQETPKQETPNRGPQQQVFVAGVAKRLIVVSLEDRKLALVEDGQVKKVYPVAVGKPSTPSPVGTFTIERRAANPAYNHDGKTVPPGPGNPVGTRWMGLSIPGYGIHGTNEPKSIGKAASHGCIRMARKDLEEFYELVQVGDTVELVGQRNQETAQLFGDGQNPAAAAEPVRVALATPDLAQVLVSEIRGGEQVNPEIAALIAAR